MFATLLGAVGLALPVRAEAKTGCPVCGATARALKKTGAQMIDKPVTLEGNSTLAIYRPSPHILYDREPAVAHRKDDGEIDWFWEDCQRCGCVFKAMM